MNSSSSRRVEPGAVLFDQVHKSYSGVRGRFSVFEGLSLTIQQGEFVSLVGSSGCGKTTLLNMVAGFVQPDAGQVLFNGQAIHGPGRERGIVFQQYAIFPWLTVRENIAFPLSLAAAKGRTPAEIAALVDHYLGLVGLERFADALPKTLSGGMKQRVAIARAYAADPQILLMDEPFAALDAQSRERMQELLLQITRAEGRTVVFVTHSIEEALYLSDRVVVLSGRPSRIAQIVEVPLGRERDKTARFSPSLVALRREIEEIIDSSIDQKELALNDV